MSNEDLEEYNKCLESPYYFATKYMGLKTHLTEEEFNKEIERLKSLNPIHLIGKRRYSYGYSGYTGYSAGYSGYVE